MPTRKKIALAIAALADAAQLGFFPVFGPGALSAPDDALDLVVAVALVLALGWRWRLLAALVCELIPGLALFPTWTAFVATLPVEPRLGGERRGRAGTTRRLDAGGA
jgi:hypothetical protein